MTRMNEFTGTPLTPRETLITGVRGATDHEQQERAVVDYRNLLLRSLADDLQSAGAIGCAFGNEGPEYREGFMDGVMFAVTALRDVAAPFEPSRTDERNTDQ